MAERGDGLRGEWRPTGEETATIAGAWRRTYCDSHYGEVVATRAGFAACAIRCFIPQEGVWIERLSFGIEASPEEAKLRCDEEARKLLKWNARKAARYALDVIIETSDPVSISSMDTLFRRVFSRGGTEGVAMIGVTGVTVLEQIRGGWMFPRHPDEVSSGSPRLEDPGSDPDGRDNQQGAGCDDESGRKNP